MKSSNLHLTLRRVRSSVRTDVSTGSRNTQSGRCGYQTETLSKEVEPTIPVANKNAK